MQQEFLPTADPFPLPCMTLSVRHVIIFSNITPGALGCADTQSKVGKAGKCWQRRQEGSGNLSHILGESLRCCRSLWVVYRYAKLKKKNKNLRNPNIVLRLRRTGGIFTLETR